MRFDGTTTPNMAYSMSTFDRDGDGENMYDNDCRHGTLQPSSHHHPSNNGNSATNNPSFHPLPPTTLDPDYEVMLPHQNKQQKPQGSATEDGLYTEILLPPKK